MLLYTWETAIHPEPDSNPEHKISPLPQKNEEIIALNSPPKLQIINTNTQQKKTVVYWSETGEKERTIVQQSS